MRTLLLLCLLSGALGGAGCSPRSATDPPVVAGGIEATPGPPPANLTPEDRSVLSEEQRRREQALAEEKRVGRSR